MHKTGLSFLLFLFSVSILAQDLDFVKHHIKTLASPGFHGRGYVKNGDIIASDYLADQFKAFSLTAFNKSYFQEYSFSINTFPGKMEVSIDRKRLSPGKDFYIYAGSSGVKGTFSLTRFNLDNIIKDSTQVRSFFRSDHAKEFVMIDTTGFGKDEFKVSMRNAVYGNLMKARGIIHLVDSNRYFTASTSKADFTRFFITKRSIPADASTITLNVDQKLIQHTARNVIGYLPGETDTFLVFTAHYDHLGRMGKDTYLPGANDNASGTAMVLDLMRALSKKQTHRYSYAFMLFSGEEAGLLGSQHYTANPYFPLSKIKQVLNFDMVGTGSGGVNIFNGTVWKKDFALLDTINKVNNFGIDLKMKSTSRGSDHYPFHQKGVPALFILTDGKETGYHVVDDLPEKLPFTAYEKLFKIIYQYIEAKENGKIIYSPNTNR
ncbi:MAG TPA: M28 family peptidase [Bacteroidales bacterium]|nr:M28 family peptidase [Bacteroidales bacterium]